jgi:hypothetical protein
MATIVTRAGKGSPLTHTEVDANFINLNDEAATKATLDSPTFTGTPAAPTASVGTNTTQLATTAFVNAEIANDAPTKTGGGASGTWGIDVTGNAATATTASALSAATWQRITGNGITQGSYGSISVTGSTTGYIGINFPDYNLTWMSDNQSSVSFGVYKNNSSWAFYFDNSGTLQVGTIPAARVSGTVASATTATTATNAIGQAQTWQVVSRAVNVSYQNTTGKPIAVSIYSSGTLQASTDNSTWVTVQIAPVINSANRSFAAAVIPNGHYYRISGGGVSSWSELR